MEAQKQEQQQHHHLSQVQPHINPNSAALSLSYDPSHSQIQPYDQSTQSYYPYNPQPQQQQQQQDYSSYYYSNYSTSYQTQNDPNSIYPPGVPISDKTQQTLIQNSPNLYYSHGVSATQPPSQGDVLDHSSNRGRGSQVSQSLRGGGCGSFGRPGQGRGSGRGRDKHVLPQAPGFSASAAATPSKPPPQKACCELCNVDCNTLEMLENHMNGKKHKKKLKMHEESKNLSQQQKMTVSDPNSENAGSDQPKGSTSPGHVPAKTEPSSEESPSEKSIGNHFIGRGGLKRSMRGGRGRKWMKTHDGSRMPVEAPKPNPGFLWICELCNAKCESQGVYESHIIGKKHLANARRFQGLHPTLLNPPSTSTIPCQPHPQDAHALASMILGQQNLPDLEAARAALAELLSQHGIHDAQTLLLQLVPYLLTQIQASGSVAATLTGYAVMNAPNNQNQGVAFPERKPEEQNVMNNVETEEGVGRNAELDNGQCLDKPIEGPLENSNVETEQAPSESAKEEQSVSEQEKQCS